MKTKKLRDLIIILGIYEIVTKDDGDSENFEAPDAHILIVDDVEIQNNLICFEVSFALPREML